MRLGLTVKKIGMTRILTDEGACYPVTVLKAEENVVIAHKTEAKHGYCAAVLGVAKTAEKKLTRPLQGFFKALGVDFFRGVRECRVATENELPEIGTSIGVEAFAIGQFIDVVGQTIGKGFAGGMKRHHFGGLRATHGVSISHRSHGSTGNRQDPGRVFKGKKMAGHLGDVRVTLQNLEVFGTDAERGLLMVIGSVPGAKGSSLLIRDAVKKQIEA
ncbi:MAG: 50S ribosomal protein L3 [Holosporales bacterium]|jgi:large subunit ribosomal protein L3|nr:50S ribosomal protein L3 [Holosporales bacterium]